MSNTPTDTTNRTCKHWHRQLRFAYEQQTSEAADKQRQPPPMNHEGPAAQRTTPANLSDPRDVRVWFSRPVGLIRQK